MRTFFLDLAGNPGALACVDDDVRAFAVADRKISDAHLLPLAEQVLADAGWTWEVVERLACVAGPGGFMSLRVAAAFTNALAWERKIPVASIHLSDLCAARLPATRYPLSAWIHSTKKQEVFARGFGRSAALWPEPTHVRLEDLLAALPDDTPLIGELIPEHAEALAGKGCRLQEMAPIQEVLPAVLADAIYEKSAIQPWYGREG
jgi:tRNA threonylcarbamoyl adenosine modification protein YeaZ